MRVYKKHTQKTACNYLINSSINSYFIVCCFEARYYRAPTFTSRDPLFEKYFWMSPYAYCANNPVKYVDPTGCIFDPAQDENYVKPMEKDIQNKLSQRIEERNKCDVGSDEYNRLNDHITELSNALTEINDLRNDKNNLYYLTFGDISFNKDIGGNYADAAGSLTYGGVKDGQNVININMAQKYAGTTGTMLHEFKHAHQYFSGELGFYINNNGKQVGNSNNQVLERAANYRGDVYSYRGTPSRNNYQLSPFYNSLEKDIFDTRAHLNFAKNNGYKYINNNKRYEKVF